MGLVLFKASSVSGERVRNYAFNFAVFLVETLLFF